MTSNTSKKERISFRVIVCLTMVGLTAPSQFQLPAASAQKKKPSAAAEKNSTGQENMSATAQEKTPATTGTRFPHDHPPEDNIGRRPKPIDSRGGGDWVLPVAAISTVAVVGLLTSLHGRGERKLDNEGPQVDRDLNMSGFTIKGFVKGNWPVVLNFEIEAGGTVLLTITNDRFSSDYQFDSTNVARREEIRILPAQFGKTPTPGVYTIRAVSRNTGQPVYFRMYGLGAGERAVGSVAIDQLRFGPQTVSRNGEAQFSFHSHSEFNRAEAEFSRLATHNGNLVHNLDAAQPVRKAIVSNITISDTWSTARSKPGEHSLRVRAWRLKANGGDWVTSWSTDLVDIEQ